MSTAAPARPAAGPLLGMAGLTLSVLGARTALPTSFWCGMERTVMVVGRRRATGPLRPPSRPGAFARRGACSPRLWLTGAVAPVRRPWGAAPARPRRSA